MHSIADVLRADPNADRVTECAMYAWNLHGDF
jgi:hypothetical protein